MTNYPPGVTGNEYAIAGGKEIGNYPAKCKSYLPSGTRAQPLGQEAVLLTSLALIGEGKYEQTFAILSQLYRDTKNMPEVFDVECEFEGKVDAEAYGGQVWWTCPRCGNETTDEVDYEPDPDDERDRRLEE